MTTGVSVRTLASPGFVVALVVLVLNDHVLKQASPGFVTGKLSDVAGLVVAPLVLAVPFGFLRVPRPVPVSIVVTGVGFTVAKTSSIGAAVTSELWSLSGFPTSIRADPSDLVALPMLYAAWLVHRRTARRPAGDWRSIVKVATGSAIMPLALIATAASDQDSCTWSGVGSLVVVGGHFTGPRDHVETRVMVQANGGWSISVDDVGVAQRLTPKQRERLQLDGGGTGARSCDGTGSCWRVGDATGGRIDYSHDRGSSWSTEYVLTRSAAAAALEDEVEQCGRKPVADLRDVAVLGSGAGTVVVISASEAGLLVRREAGDWELLTLDTLFGLPFVPEPTPTDDLITPLPGRNPQDETSQPTCETPATVSVTPSPQNGPPTSYVSCP